MAFKLGITVLPGYPQQVGAKYQLMFDRTGPTSYTQFTAATGVGGDVLKATQGGLNFGGFDNVDDTYDSTGQINAVIVMYLAGYGNAVPQVTIKYVSQVTATLGGQAQTANTEIVAGTNLSTFSFRFQAMAV